MLPLPSPPHLRRPASGSASASTCIPRPKTPLASWLLRVWQRLSAPWKAANRKEHAATIAKTASDPDDPVRHREIVRWHLDSPACTQLLDQVGTAALATVTPLGLVPLAPAETWVRQLASDGSALRMNAISMRDDHTNAELQLRVSLRVNGGSHNLGQSELSVWLCPPLARTLKEQVAYVAVLALPGLPDRGRVEEVVSDLAAKLELVCANASPWTAAHAESLSSQIVERLVQGG